MKTVRPIVTSGGLRRARMALDATDAILARRIREARTRAELRIHLKPRGALDSEAALRAAKRDAVHVLLGPSRDPSFVVTWVVLGTARRLLRALRRAATAGLV
jgi:hypothetical protein